ncbi:threonine/serine ThrE exporter family protein [Viridibacterium curvum]|uniref:Threonine/serine exporter family protein n=1 Tax=Viridibacterium curvum TaxID=1101404 RepID=A0ABP9QE39_9RHOO
MPPDTSPLSSIFPGDSADVLRFLQLAARLLLEYNIRTELIRRRLAEAAKVLGLPVTVAVGYRTVTIYTAQGSHVHAQAPEFRINIAVSGKVNGLLDELAAGQLSLPAAQTALESVEREAGRHNRWLLATIFGAGAAALAALFNGDAVAMSVIALSSALGLLVRQELAKRHVMLFALPFTAALIGSLLGGSVIALGWTTTPGICLIVPALMLVPGPHLINALYDVVENHMQTGVPRLALACTILLAAAMGIFLGGWITLGMSTVPPWHTPADAIPLWLDVLLAGIAACSFGAFYNAPWRVLWTSIACGMVGHGIRYLCLAHNVSLEMATFFACLAIGMMAAQMVRQLRVPFAAVAFAGAVPMMPGVLMFRGIGGAMDIAMAGTAATPELVASTLASLFKSGFVVGAMGLGLLLGAKLAEVVTRSRG